MNDQQFLIVSGSLAILVGSVGEWSQTTLAVLYFIANMIIFIGMRR